MIKTNFNGKVTFVNNNCNLYYNENFYANL